MYRFAADSSDGPGGRSNGPLLLTEFEFLLSGSGVLGEPSSGSSWRC
jgi:hypothetical protein